MTRRAARAPVRKLRKNMNLVMYASSETDSNMYYATRFIAPDPFLFVQIGEKKMLAVGDLEYGRAKEQAQVDEVLRLAPLEEKLKKSGINNIRAADIIADILREHGTSETEVPDTFPVLIADELRERGIKVIPKKDRVVFPQRQIKTKEEIEAIRDCVKVAEECCKACAEILRWSEEKLGLLYYKGEPLTSEYLRKIIDQVAMSRECITVHTIVASGNHGSDPHNGGTGPIKAGETLILDIFPRSTKTLYWGDFTRTLLKGKANPEVKKLYDDVARAQDFAFSMIKGGSSGKKIHEAVVQFFKDEGYYTGPKDGKIVGFFHGVGHGLGLDIHEPPSISQRGSELKTGTLVTVEPGLYYFGLGSVRLEDVVLVKEDGCENLTTFPRFLEI